MLPCFTTQPAKNPLLRPHSPGISFYFAKRNLVNLDDFPTVIIFYRKHPHFPHTIISIDNCFAGHFQLFLAPFHWHLFVSPEINETHDWANLLANHVPTLRCTFLRQDWKLHCQNGYSLRTYSFMSRLFTHTFVVGNKCLSRRKWTLSSSVRRKSQSKRQSLITITIPCRY